MLKPKGAVQTYRVRVRIRDSSEPVSLVYCVQVIAICINSCNKQIGSDRQVYAVSS